MTPVLKFGIYYFKIKKPNGDFITNEVNVRVIGENDFKFKIILNGYTNTKKPNDSMIVKKKNVKIIKVVEEIIKPETAYEEIEYWWQKI